MEEIKIPRILNIKETAQLMKESGNTRISESYLRRLCKTKKGFYITNGRRILINVDKLIEILNCETEEEADFITIGRYGTDEVRPLRVVR